MINLDCKNVKKKAALLPLTLSLVALSHSLSFAHQQYSAVSFRFDRKIAFRDWQNVISDFGEPKVKCCRFILCDDIFITDKKRRTFSSIMPLFTFDKIARRNWIRLEATSSQCELIIFAKQTMELNKKVDFIETAMASR